jgi:hypothetical protein
LLTLFVEERGIIETRMVVDGKALSQAMGRK